MSSPWEFGSRVFVAEGKMRGKLGVVVRSAINSSVVLLPDGSEILALNKHLHGASDSQWRALLGADK